jgi:hypothetical protein
MPNKTGTRLVQLGEPYQTRTGFLSTQGVEKWRNENECMAELAHHDAILAQAEPPMPQKKLWLRQGGESKMWYNRFRRYLGLGPKRSLQAAVEDERKEISALKSTKDESKPTSAGKKGEQKGAKGSSVKLKEVPKPKPLQVPGSWKQACTKYRWVERARSWDEHLVDQAVEKHLLEEVSGMGRKGTRVRVLKQLAEKVAAQLNDAEGMKFHVYCMLVARLQSILQDIKDEMDGYDESLERLLLKKETWKLYQEQKS